MMCDTSSSKHSISRRSILGAALAGAGGIAAGSLAGTPAQAAPLPDPNPLQPVLPTKSSQPFGPVITQLGTAGGPQAEYVRTGTSTVLTVEGYNYVIDTGRSSVTQYLNAGLEFSRLAGIFITHLHADHLADYFNYFLLEGGQPNAEGDMLLNPPPPGPGTGPALPVPTFGPGSAGALPPQPPPPQTPPDKPTITPSNPVPGLKTLTDRMIEAYAYSFNVFIRGDGYHSIYDWTSAVKEIAIPASAKASATSAATRAPIGMKPFKIFEDKRVKVTAILVPHGEVFPCYAYRFDIVGGRSVVFSGDTSKSDNVVTLAQDADVLVHCAMEWEVVLAGALAHGKKPDDPLLVHLKNSLATTQEAGQVARAAGVPQLVLTHLIPSNPKDVPDALWKFSASTAARYHGNVHVGNDFDQIPVLPRSKLRMTSRRGHR